MKKLMTHILILFATFFSAAAIAKDYLHEGPLLIRNVNLVDGLGNLSNPMRDILIDDGVIQQISSAGKINDLPENSYILEADGMSAMPGLIELHAHVASLSYDQDDVFEVGLEREDIQRTLNAYLYAGVTSILDIGNKHDFIVNLRDQINSGERMGPRIFPVGQTIHRLHTVKGIGSMPNAETKAEIQGLLDERQNDGMELVKIYNAVSPWEARHLVKAAHERGMRVVADYWCSNMSRTIFEVTALDGFAHGSCRELTEEEAQWIAHNNKFVILTMAAFDYMGGHRAYADYEKRGFLKEPLIVDPLGKEYVREYYRTFSDVREFVTVGEHSFFQAQHFGDMTNLLPDNQKNAFKLYKAGALIGLGTDANWPPGNWPGDALHHEILLHQQAGIPNEAVIQMATLNGARILKQDKLYGSIEKGKVADVVLVSGNPLVSIEDTRKVVHVIKDGKLVNRKALKAKH